MSHSIVHAVFLNNADAGGAITALTNSGFTPSQFYVIGKDSDSFRMATATLESDALDSFMIGFGILGALIGTAIGAVGVYHMPGFDATYITPVQLTASFAGLALGLVVGLMMGAIVRIDRMPPSAAEIRIGAVNDGDIAVSVTTNNSKEMEQVQLILAEHAATHLSIDLVQDVIPATRPELVLSKTA